MKVKPMQLTDCHVVIYSWNFEFKLFINSSFTIFEFLLVPSAAKLRYRCCQIFIRYSHRYSILF